MHRGGEFLHDLLNEMRTVSAFFCATTRELKKITATSPENVMATISHQEKMSDSTTL
jgi:hypothetical protein